MFQTLRNFFSVFVFLAKRAGSLSHSTLLTELAWVKRVHLAKPNALVIFFLFCRALGVPCHAKHNLFSVSVIVGIGLSEPAR